MKYVFIVNEKAGKGKYKKIIPNIEKACEKRNYKYEIRYITDTLNSIEIAKEYTKQPVIIYMVGGDGTITKALGGIVGTKNALGIIPAGSGNDTYRTVQKLPEGKTDIDIGKINDTYFINVACTGLDAEVANNVDNLRNTWVPSKHLYEASILYTFFHYKFKEGRLSTSVKTIKNKYSIISICNGSYYGGGFQIAPKSLLTDGFFDVYYVEKMPKIKMVPLLLKLKKGKHEGKRRIHKFRSKHIELELMEEVTFNVDGDQLTASKFTIDMLPKALTIYNEKELVKEILERK